MNILDELNEALSGINIKIQNQEELTEEDVQTLFLKSLIEEETGNAST